MARYGMFFDLNRCVRCRTCYVVCKVMHHISDQFDHDRRYTRIRFVELEAGKYPSVKVFFVPTHCMHCDETACVDVCPTGASAKREDGIVTLDKDRCIGCKCCIAACHYGARYFNEDEGVVDRCSFCVDRIDSGLQPYCVEACLGDAIVFGDLDDPDSTISKLIAAKGAMVLSPGMGTHPKVYYAYVESK